MTLPFSTTTDILIVGAGPAGLCLARALSGHRLHIAIIDQQSLDCVKAPSFDGRDIALTPASVRILKHLKIWERVAANECVPLRHARVCNGSSRNSLRIGHEPGQQPELGWLVPNHLLRKAAYEAVERSIADHADVQLITDQSIAGIETDAEMAHVTLENGQIITAQLVVAADSRFSATRRMMGISADMHDFGKSMLVCRMKHDEPHHHTALEWFGYDRTIALLPAAPKSGTQTYQSSIVITVSESEAKALATLNTYAFNRKVEQWFEQRMGRMRLASTRHVYPLVAVYPDRFISTRFALVGDAAVGMHPVTAHGFNFGLTSIKTLSDEVIHAHETGQDFASKSLLKRYESRHRRMTRPLYQITRFIAELYTRSSPPARLLREAMLHAAEQIAPFKKYLARSLSQWRDPDSSSRNQQA